MMTKKDFIELADRIRGFNNEPCCGNEGFSICQIEALADVMRSINPHFNRERWIDYINGECGPNGGRIK